MKMSICFVLLFTFSTIAHAQQPVETEITKAYQYSQQSLEAAKRSADHLRFFEGAYDNAEIKDHFAFAREDLDSMYFYAKNASYKCADAAYYAKTNSNEKIEEKAKSGQAQFKAIAGKIDQIIKKIDEYIVHGTYNRDAYITQFIQDFNETYKQLATANNQLEQIQMMLTIKPIN